MKTPIPLLLCIALIICSSCSRNKISEHQIQSLQTACWQFRQAGQNTWFPATVPGTVHTDLLNNQQIEDPFFACNEEQVQWIEKADWEYRCHFVPSDAIRKKAFLQLRFWGLDTYADVYLNDSLVLQANNMFRHWNIPCKDLLKSDTNTIKVLFHAPIAAARPAMDAFPYPLPDARGFTRKAPYQYGWDWGPRLLSSGIWKPVELHGWNHLELQHLQLIQKKLTNQQADLEALLEIQSATAQTVKVNLMVDKQHIKNCCKKIHLQAGYNRIQLAFTIPQPERWWSNGLGKARLYEVGVELKKNKQLLDRKHARIGLRTLELVQQNDSLGKSFLFKLNGVPLFIKGANYIPQDLFLPRVTDTHYRQLIAQAHDAHMNMLRVWGGGVYENEHFYDLCDENGLLVWQDFMFACNMYPGDSAFINNVTQEAIQNVKRLRNHACLALWCGNNESSEGWFNWGWQKSLGYSKSDSLLMWESYQKLFHQVLPQVVAQHDPGRYYWPSSPSIGWGDSLSMRQGDSHYWGVWWGHEPFEVYKQKTGRFMSEFGFQGMPSLPTIKSFTHPQDRYCYSEAMKSHQKHPTGYATIETYMNRDYRQPKDFESMVYISQLLQAEGIRIALEAHRRAKPRCMGTLYWQLNDCWPVTSWSSLDYHNQWKALHYTAKKAFQEILLTVNQNKDSLQLFVVSDRLSSFNGQLKISLSTFTGKTLWTHQLTSAIAANSSAIKYRILTDSLLKDCNPAQVVLKAQLMENGKILAQNHHYFCPVKDLLLNPPQLDYTLSPMADGWNIRITTRGLAKNIWLQTDEGNGHFSNNFFDLASGDTVHVKWNGQNKTDLKQALKIRSLTDSY